MAVASRRFERRARRTRAAIGSLCTAALVLGVAVPSTAQAEDAAFLWRGVKHTWNTGCHFGQRIGSWITQLCPGSTCIGGIYSSGRHGSGVNSDVFNYRTAYTSIVADNAGFQNGSVTIEITGQEGTYISGTETVAIDAASNMANLDNYVGLLNGFDLEHADIAKRYDRIKIVVGDVTYDSGTDTLEFDINWGLRMGTGGSIGTISYDLRVDYLIAGGDNGDMRYTNDQLVITDYSWNDTDVESFTDHKKQGTITYPNATHPSHAPTAGTVGLRGFNINLDSDYYLNQLVIRVREISYDDVNYSATYTGDAFFRAFGSGSVPKVAGSTTDMRLYTTLLEFDSATIDDTLFKAGNYTTPGTEQSYHYVEIP